MRLREIRVGCFGGGTGLPSLLGGLKRNPWLSLNAVVTMFDSGGSSGQLRDELGVLPPGDILRCALALARNEGEARRVLLSRLPTLEHAAARRAHRRQPAAVDDAAVHRRFSRRRRRACARCWAVKATSGRSASSRRCCAPSTPTARSTAARSRSIADTTRGHEVRDVWLEPDAHILPAVRDAIATFDAVMIGPGSFFTSLMPTLLVDGVKEALATVERSDHPGRESADGGTRDAGLHGRPTPCDWVEPHDRSPGRRGRCSTRACQATKCWRATSAKTSGRSTLGAVPTGTEVVEGDFWCTDIARHDRRRLSYAVWSVLSRRLFDDAAGFIHDARSAAIAGLVSSLRPLWRRKRATQER